MDNSSMVFFTVIEASLLQKKLESINLGASNVTFVTKGEILSNFLSKPNEEPKLN